MVVGIFIVQVVGYSNGRNIKTNVNVDVMNVYEYIIKMLNKMDFLKSG